MQKLVDVSADPIRGVLNVLLEDKTTGQNVVWGTDAYASKGSGYDAASEIKADALLRESRVVLQPRIEKDVEEQQERTKKRAEVYTPSWLCNKMNNYCDEVCFGRKKVFNVENDDQTWTPVDQPVYFVDKNKRRKIKDWQLYVDSRRLEITCGEAPFLVSRYDAATGELLPLKKRIGILDRKLRVVDENAKTENDWLKWAQRAVESCYGYEYQGDSLLIARINVLLTFYDYYEKRWGKPPTKSLIKKIANIVAWNIWQMDGINDVVPMTRIELQRSSMPLIEFSDPEFLLEESSENFLETPSKIKNWRSRKSFEFKKLKEAGFMKKKMFDFVIGNPPYQEEFSSDGNKTYAAPVYNIFMEAAYRVANSAELIHPARFLFNAGSTPKDWNRKMLEDPHFKVLSYEEDATQVFPNTDIKGGVAVTFHDLSKNFGAIQVFTKYPELNSILRKVGKSTNMCGIVISRTAYRLTDKMHKDHPEALAQLTAGHPYDMATNIFEILPQIFFDLEPKDSNEYIQILGRTKSGRLYKFVRRDYVNNVINLDCYKVFLPSANGNGNYGEILSHPLIALPGSGSTETFISIGTFDSQNEAENCLKYIKSRFARGLLGVLKSTQHLTPDKWAYVPLQDFTSNSDIDWTQSIKEIDQQLYKKYGLSQEEIDFIETHVKEMN
ncbi:MAG: Eco57I restriction-modification methylase domain-containing protein [Thermoguttaceae bacterium]|nr:Eco57I restriction-modification methylase domain-containing protein [Thermoguttaceae bacterium]